MCVSIEQIKKEVALLDFTNHEGLYIEIKKCEICGKEFYPKRSTQKTCLNEECKRKINYKRQLERAKKKRGGIKCKCCNKVIENPTNEVQMFCSVECRKKHYKEYGMNYNGTLRCKECGITFTTHIPAQKYCCTECRVKAQKKRELRRRFRDYDKY